MIQIRKNRSFGALALFGILSFFSLAYAAEGIVEFNVDWLHLIMGLFAGLAFFLYGMELMSSALNKSAGSRMRAVLSSVTKHPTVAFLVGIVVTVIIQSSSATTVMLVSFVQSGLLTFGKTLAVILGASVGTTVTAQLVAFDIQTLAYFMVALGFLLSFVWKKKDYIRYAGEAIMGFGILFVGMQMMSHSMAPLRQFPTFIELMRKLENPYLGVLFAGFFTAIIQSSAAFLGIVFVLAKQQIIGLDAGVPLVIGTNIGTCVTALLASIGASRDAVRVAVTHILFKVVGALIFIWWIPQFGSFVMNLSRQAGIVEPARLIANAHTFYNVGLALLFFPFLKYFERFVLFLLPDKPVTEHLPPVLSVKHLDFSMLATPSLAIDVARSEIARMAQNIRMMLSASIIPIISDEFHNDDEYPHMTLVEGILHREKKINFLEKEVKDYLIKVCQQPLNDSQAREAYSLITIAQDLESIADIVSKGVVPQISKKRASDINFSIEGLEELTIFHSKACKQLARVHGALHVLDPQKAERIVAKMEGYLHLDEDYRLLHLERLREHRTETLATHDLHSALMDCFKRITVHTGEIAKVLSHLRS